MAAREGPACLSVFHVVSVDRLVGWNTLGTPVLASARPMCSAIVRIRSGPGKGVPDFLLFVSSRSTSRPEGGHIGRLGWQSFSWSLDGYLILLNPWAPAQMPLDRLFSFEPRAPSLVSVAAHGSATKPPRFTDPLHAQHVAHVEHHNATTAPQWAALSTPSLRSFVTFRYRANRPFKPGQAGSHANRPEIDTSCNA